MSDAKKNPRKPKGDGSLQQLPNGKYKVQVTVGYDAAGRQIRKSVTVNSQSEAVKTKTSLLNAQQKGTLVKPNKCKFGEYIKRWLTLKEAELKKTTFESYDYTCRKYIIPILGNVQIQKITTIQVNDYLTNKIKEGLSPRTLQKHRTILHGIVNSAIKEGFLSINPISNCRTLRSNSEEVKTLTPGEVKLLLETARNIRNAKGKNFTQIYHIVKLALASGLRRGEILALKWDCINTEKGTLTVKEGLYQVKGGLLTDTPKSKSSRRTISIDKGVLQELEELRIPDSEWIFHTYKGKPLSPMNVGRSYRKLLKDVDLEGYRFHDLRHTHATQLIANGMNIKMVSERLGHNDISITLSLYVHSLPRQDQEAAERIASILF
jgi:integrase